MNIENQVVEISSSFEELVLAEIKEAKNPLGFLKMIRSDIKAVLNRIYESKFLRFYYKTQLRVIETLILREEKQKR